MAEWFPSKEWLESYQTRLDADEVYADESEGWGVDFNGDFLFVLTQLPLEETTFGELPDELTDDFADRIDSLADDEFDRLRETATPLIADRYEEIEADDDRERFTQAIFDTSLDDVPDVTWPELEEHLQGDLESLLDQLETYVTDDSKVRAFVELEDGDCHRVELLTDPSSYEPGFTLKAPYDTWTELIEGADVIEYVMSNRMQLDGDVTRVLHYGDAAAAMGDVAGETDAQYLF